MGNIFVSPLNIQKKINVGVFIFPDCLVVPENYLDAPITMLIKTIIGHEHYLYNSVGQSYRD